MSYNKIKLLKTRNIIYQEDTPPKTNQDYILALRVALQSIEEDLRDTEHVTYVYKMAVLHPEFMQEVGSDYTPRIAKGYTMSQQLRFSIKAMFQRTGEEDNEDNYEKQMRRIIEYVNKKGL